mmetsp:Transcript_18142/g.26480  ORF Transcript_18142/g.26480 Transcript_18142/m.26480 type:complete len:86 (-) Transcript_18142:958-1215(-)
MWMNLRIKQVMDPAKPIKKLKTITNMLQALGDLNKKVIMYVKPAAAGPKQNNKIIVPTPTSLSDVVNASTPKAYIMMTTIHKGNW